MSTNSKGSRLGVTIATVYMLRSCVQAEDTRQSTMQGLRPREPPGDQVRRRRRPLGTPNQRELLRPVVPERLLRRDPLPLVEEAVVVTEDEEIEGAAVEAEEKDAVSPLEDSSLSTA